MRALIQRVSRAQVTVQGEIIGQIGAGLLILVCAMRNDTTAEAEKLAAKIAKQRIFRDAEGKMNRSLLDSAGAALVVSQFTLAGDTSRGNRPGFSSAAPPDEGEALYLHFAQTLAGLGIEIAKGQFGADMAVELVIDGPVTLWLDTSAA